MKRKFSKILLALVLGVVMVVGTGCSSFDASAYVQAVLDANFKNETAKYMEITSASEESANAVFTDNVDGLVSAFLTDMEVSDSVKEHASTVMENVVRAAKYEVGEAKKDGDTYTVDVTFYQMQLFANISGKYDTEIEAYTKKMEEDAMNSGEVPSDQEITDYVSTLLFDLVQEQVDAGITYGDGEVLTFHIEKADDGTYMINDSDYQQIINYAMDFDAIP